MQTPKSLNTAEFEACLCAIVGLRQKEMKDNSSRLQIIDQFDKTRRTHGRLAAMMELSARAAAANANKVVDITPYLKQSKAPIPAVVSKISF